MPNRIIREGWIESDRIDMLKADEECFFLRLCLKADDFGRYSANPKLLRSALFPLRDDVRESDIARKLTAVERAGLVRTYEVEGKRYAVIPNFRQRTRASESRYPEPPDGCLTDDGRMPDTSQTAAHVFGDGDDLSETEAEAAARGGARTRPPGSANAPPLAAALAFFAGNGSDYKADEVREAHRQFEANRRQDGVWMWGSRPVGDWRAAMEQRIVDNRKKTHGNSQRNRGHDGPGTLRNQGIPQENIDGWNAQLAKKMAGKLAGTGGVGLTDPGDGR